MGLEVCPFTESLVIRQTDLRLVVVKGVYTQLCGRKEIIYTTLWSQRDYIHNFVVVKGLYTQLWLVVVKELYTQLCGRKGIIYTTLWS